MADWSLPPGAEVWWCCSSAGAVPPGAVHGGRDADGGDIYVGRVMSRGDVIPAKICPSQGCAYFCRGGVEEKVHSYETLRCDGTAWREASGGSVPDRALPAGQTADGELLYVGRTLVENTLTVGKVQPSHGCLYVPYGGEERRATTYEVLVLI